MAVLLIDSNKLRCERIQNALKKTALGVDLNTFSDLETALKWAERVKLNLVIVDQLLLPLDKSLKSLACPVLVLRSKEQEKDYKNLADVVDSLGNDFTDYALQQRIINLLKLSRLVHTNFTNDQKQEFLSDRFHLAFTGTNDGVWDWSRQDEQIYFSDRWLEMIGYHKSDGDLDARFWFSRVHPDDVSILDTALSAHINGTMERLSCEYRMRHKNGSYVWVHTRGQAIRDGRGKVNRIVGTQTDITDRKKAEQKVAHNALHDPLTGLANRALLMERLEQIILQHRRDASLQFGVLFIDLDLFKDINDSMGHEAGDEILQRVAHRLQECCRASDTLSRLGGDEFVLLAVGSDAEKDVVLLANRILDELSRPFLIQGKDVFIGASIGIVCQTQDYTEPEKAIRDADLALYQAKADGRNRYKIFDPSMKMPLSKHFALQTTLTGALDRGELFMKYQPILDFKTMTIQGFESLMRWRHPENGHIFPADFIPIAEETGLINKMGLWALMSTTKQLVRWKSEIPHAQHWHVTVNVSALQLESDQFVSQVKAALEESGLQAKYLTLEITETVLMHKIEVVLPTIMMLKQLGVQLAIDDFGTGYSSLVVLNDYPFDIIKVPREFIKDIDQRPKAPNTLRLIRLLADETRMKTIFEGMETEQEVEVISRLDPDMVQGFYYSKPLSANEVSELFKVSNIFKQSIRKELQTNKA